MPAPNRTPPPIWLQPPRLTRCWSAATLRWRRLADRQGSCNERALLMLRSCPAPRRPLRRPAPNRRHDEASVDLKYQLFRGVLNSLYFSGAYAALKPLTGGVGAILMLHHVRPARHD